MSQPSSTIDAEQPPARNVLSRRTALHASGALLAAVGLGGVTAGSPASAHAARGHRSDRAPAGAPTIVLAHGAWADGSGWSKVIRSLQADGYTVVAPAVGLESLSADIAAVRKLIADLQTPALVVGHSYGGAVISGAASGLTNVTGLVFLAAFAPDQGESVFALVTQFEQQYGPALVGQLLRPDGPFDSPQTRVYLDRASFGAAFAQDLDADQTAILAATQRPISVGAFGEPLPVVPAWRQLRSWYQVSTQDRVIQPAAQRWAAQRIGAETIELDASHASLLAQPAAVAKLIRTAALASLS